MCLLALVHFDKAVLMTMPKLEWDARIYLHNFCHDYASSHPHPPKVGFSRFFLNKIERFKFLGCELSVAKFSPGMRVVIRDEEWMIKKVESNSLGGETLNVIGLSPLVKDRQAQFIPNLEDDIGIVDPLRGHLCRLYNARRLPS